MIDSLLKYCERMEPCGSRVTCVPAPTDTDQDWLLLVKPESLSELLFFCTSTGWVVGGSHIQSELDDKKFISLTLGDDNIIITTSIEFFNKHQLATNVAKRLNILNKDHRICLFQAILYGVSTS